MSSGNEGADWPATGGGRQPVSSGPSVADGSSSPAYDSSSSEVDVGATRQGAISWTLKGSSALSSFGVTVGLLSRKDKTYLRQAVITLSDAPVSRRLGWRKILALYKALDPPEIKMLQVEAQQKSWLVIFVTKRVN